MVTTLAPQQANRTPTSGYVAVKVEMLRRLKKAPVDLFVQNDRRGDPVLYLRAGHPFAVEHLTSLADVGVREIFVRSGEFQDFGKDLLESVQSLVTSETVPYAERFAALQIALATEIERAAHMIDSGPYVHLAHKVADDLTALLVGNDVLPGDLFRLARHDFDTFTHVTNVTGYSVILAQRMGICDPVDLNKIATGAMLHDIGKRFIPAKILSKPAKLDPEERAVIETHPQRGYEDLCRRNDVTQDQLMMVYQHHERVDGNGYPVGLVADEIHPWARMLAVVDVFDAMTGNRPYRQPATPQNALKYVKENAGKHFDPHAVECWYSALTAT